MDTVKQLISDNSKKYEHFDYYLTIIDKAQVNVNSNPDISIESCKSLIEGISKSILQTMDSTYSAKAVDKLELSPLVKKMLGVMSENDTLDDSFHADFVTRCGSLVQVLGEIRNTRGDISHGRAAPKEDCSSVHLSSFVLNITESLVFYILREFFTLDLSYMEFQIEYEDNEEFNDFLDEQNPLEGISYSKALFDQDEIYYTELLEDYNLSEDENDSGK